MAGSAPSATYVYNPSYPNRVQGPSNYRTTYDPAGNPLVTETPIAAGTDAREFLQAAGQGTSSPSLVGLWNATGIGNVGEAPTVGQVPPAGAAPSAGPVGNVNYPSTAAADAAAFGRAKDQAAQMTQGSLQGLRQALDARGIGGAGYEAGQTANALIAGTNLEGEASRDIAMKDADLAEHAADENFSGGITQRGQTLSAQEAAQQNATAQRGQDIQTEEANANLAEQNAALKATTSLDMLRLALGVAPRATVGGNSMGGWSANATLY